MTEDISLTAVYQAMTAMAGAPDRRAGMIAALESAGLWDETQRHRADIALSAYGILGPGSDAEGDMRRALRAVAEFTKPKPARTEATAAEVLAAVREYVTTADEPWFEVGYQLLRQVAVPLRLDTDSNSRAGQRDWRKFSGQVSRALIKLAGEGVLRKAARGEPMPGGRRAWAVLYMTPDAWEKAEVQAAVRMTAEEAAAKRRERLRTRLAALGIKGRVSHQHTMILEPEAWDVLVQLAENAEVMRKELT